MQPNYRYEGEYNSAKKQGKQEAIEFILNHNYGSTIGFLQIAQILGYNLDDEREARKFKSRMAFIKNYLINYGYILKSISGVGYYILKPKQISGYCYHTYIKHTEDLLKKSDRILSHVDKDELSDIRKEEYNSVLLLNYDVFENIDSTIDASEYFKNKEKYDNLEDD